MIRRYELNLHDSRMFVPHEDGTWTLYTDHLREIESQTKRADAYATLLAEHKKAEDAFREENKRLREELALFKSDMPPAKDIADLMAYYDSCESMYLNHGFRLEEGDFERFRRANIWIRSIAAKVEQNKGEVK